ncbi:sensor histidine kinase [Cryobacterium soli]|jgi:two-component system OmpR family sensor kinase|uniref:sensor histidine kinase n=1 Tax=Cryobacterium soli TaxID=2220095 RepID=UPI0013C450E6|nr:HAMP domain-containing sensor histidine kinase [Cryobacterium soli]
MPARPGIAEVGLLDAIGAPTAVTLALSGVCGLTAAVLALAGRPGLALLTSAVALLAGWLSVAGLVRKRRTQLTTSLHLHRLEARRAEQVSVLSHEIRTPLAVILGSAELLAEQAPGPLTERQSVFIRRILDNATRMQSLAEQLLMQARIEAGLFEVHPATVDIRALMRSVVEDLAQVTEVPIVLDTLGAPVRAYIDAQLIRQVVTNLIMNAVHSDPHSSRVEVRVVAGDDQVMVSVSDGGTGMTDHQRDRLFRKFSSGQPLGNGTGIGLFISQQLIEMHGGRIFVDTISGKGTTMMFTLPLTGRSRG